MLHGYSSYRETPKPLYLGPPAGPALGDVYKMLPEGRQHKSSQAWFPEAEGSGYRPEATAYIIKLIRQPPTKKIDSRDYGNTSLCRFVLTVPWLHFIGEHR